MFKMDILIPCRFGEKAFCNGKEYFLSGVSWYKWSRGTEYTYFFSVNDKWHSTDFYTTFESDAENYIKIPDSLLEDGFIKEKGFPLKGKGYATGISFKDEKLYIDFIMTSNYLAHIKVQCDSLCRYIPNGDIIFPPSWDTDEKRDKAILKSAKESTDFSYQVL